MYYKDILSDAEISAPNWNVPSTSHSLRFLNRQVYVSERADGFLQKKAGISDGCTQSYYALDASLAQLGSLLLVVL